MTRANWSRILTAIVAGGACTGALAAGELPDGCRPAGASKVDALALSVKGEFPPPQLAIRTPVEPTAFPSNGRYYLLYELHLQNFSGEPMLLKAIDVVDAAQPLAPPLTRYALDQIDQVIRPENPSRAPNALGEPLDAGKATVVFLCLAFDSKAAVPARLSHRVTLEKSTVQGPAIGTRTTAMRVLGPPVTGPGWIASNAPSNITRHRTGILVFDGEARISRRYSIDWKKWQDGAPFKGNEADVRAHFAYGEPLVAVADGVVVKAVDGFPDNVPRTASAGFTPALPITADTIGGNEVVIDIGGGQFASYAHMQPGSVRVKRGERVRRGQLLGRIGNSGDARLPHVHFQVTDRPDLLASEGLPFLIDRFQLRTADGKSEQRRRELPVRDMLIDFPPLARSR